MNEAERKRETLALWHSAPPDDAYHSAADSQRGGKSLMNYLKADEYNSTQRWKMAPAEVCKCRWPNFLLYVDKESESFRRQILHKSKSQTWYFLTLRFTSQDDIKIGPFMAKTKKHLALFIINILKKTLQNDPYFWSMKDENQNLYLNLKIVQIKKHSCYHIVLSKSVQIYK